MKTQFLIPYPLGQSPSQRFRFEQYLHILEQNGVQVSYQSFWDQQTWFILYKTGHSFHKVIGFVKGVARRLTVLFQLSDIDFVFVHRECLPIGPPVIEWIIVKILKKKIIYDFDDAIWLPNTSQENRIAAFLKWHSKVASICKWSYKISCGNAFLASYALQFNNKVTVNPTTIDTNHLHNPSLFLIQKKSPQVVIGWTGTQSTLPYIESLFSLFEKLEEKFPDQVRLLIISNKKPSLKLKFIDFIQWSKETEVNDLLLMDIGVMPLSDDMWAKGKCGFKALQYMALEIPALVSPVGVNTEIVNNNVNGYWCNTETEWFDCLEKLLMDKVLRKEIGSAGRKKVISHYSVLSNASTFLGLFS
jgi:glycosyltransferase involved in cell wall biosynthesis